MRLRPLGSTVLLLSIATNLRAETLEHVLLIERAAVPHSATLQAPRFDAGLGELQRVELVLDAHVEGALAFENLLDTPNVLQANFGSRALIHARDGSLLLQTAVEATFFSVLPAFDGSLDFQGASAEQHTGLSALMHADVALVAAGDLARFRSLPGDGLSRVQLDVSFVNTSGGPTGVAYAWRQNSGGVLRVRYLYAPVGALPR